MRNLAIAAVLTVLPLTGVGVIDAQAQEKEEIVFGVAAAASGWMAAYDEPAVNSARLAIEELNAKGGLLGRQVKFLHVDNKTDRAQSAKAGVELMQEGAEFLMISCDFDIGAPAALVANQNGVVSMSTCGGAIELGNKSAGDMVYSMASEGGSTGALLADWAYHLKGWRTAYTLLDVTIEYDKSLCRGFTTEFTNLAGADSVVLADTFKNNDPSISGQISRYKTLPEEADIIMLCSYTPGQGSAIRQLRAAGVTAPIMTGTVGDGDAWVAAVPELSDFFYSSYVSLRGDDPRTEVSDFVDRYTTRYGERPPMGLAITGYSVVEAWSRAVEQAGSTDGRKVNAELEKFRREPFLVGATTFTSEFHMNEAQIRPMVIFEYVQGKPMPLGYYDMQQHKMVEWWKE